LAIRFVLPRQALDTRFPGIERLARGRSLTSLSAWRAADR
jgi:hypothetical protein